jgi:hypothetical protein
MTSASWLFDDLSNPLALDAGTNSDGWYTPSWLVEKARAVLPRVVWRAMNQEAQHHAAA